VAGEMKDGRRNLVRALLVGVLAVVAIYLLVNIACLNVLGVVALGKTLTPTSDVLHIVAGPIGGKLAAAAVALSAIGYLSQSMLTGPRVYFAMARDGLFFRQAAAIGEHSRAPVVAIVLQAIWTGILALSGSYERILSYVIAMNFLFFGLSASCIFVMRRREAASGARVGGFRAPLYPWSIGLFILFCVVVVLASFWTHPTDSLVGYAIMALGLPPYLYWRRASREPVPQ
jgi:APA family basic amino acid/polyamine antiporter